MRAKPVPPSGALLINALHSPSRQILHIAPPSGRGAEFSSRRAAEAAQMPDCDAATP